MKSRNQDRRPARSPARRARRRSPGWCSRTQPTIDDDAEERAARRRAVARSRLCDPRGSRAAPRRHRPCGSQQARRPAQLHHLPPRQDHGLAGLYPAGAGFQALPRRPAAVRARGQRARRDRDGQSRDAGAGGAVARRPAKAAILPCGWAMPSSSSPAPAAPARFSLPTGSGWCGRPIARRWARSFWPSLRPDQLKRFLERVDLKPSTEKSITDHPGAAARDRRGPAQRRSPSTTASSIPRCAASRCRSRISPAR